MLRRILLCNHQADMQDAEKGSVTFALVSRGSDRASVSSTAVGGKRTVAPVMRYKLFRALDLGWHRG